MFILPELAKQSARLASITGTAIVRHSHVLSRNDGGLVCCLFVLVAITTLWSLVYLHKRCATNGLWRGLSHVEDWYSVLCLACMSCDKHSQVDESKVQATLPCWHFQEPSHSLIDDHILAP